ncbi:MAG: DNA polymerase III subunit gamma/tau [Eubacteriaceae bacterium]|nr:DNA polymerase III subunit gamma/tau [Eubacteriaceae bacterium]
MAYQVLYRQFRPGNFNEIVGQEHIIPILKNQIKTGNISHAYLFSGPRGTGKTSAAKVFAKAVNCLAPEEGEPCGKCELCTAGQTNSLSNVIEIDAASNRGIDEIRKLREEVNFLPAKGKYRVYIIDEVHMLTNEAFNALLKTLEEPPEHIIFIFATTEVYKVIPTILSRCQRYDFKRIPSEVIKSRLRDSLAEISVECEEGALNIITSAADGALRDAWSLADKVLAASPEGILSEKAAKEVLGNAASSDIMRIAEAVCEGDIPGAFAALTESIDSGADTDDILSNLTEYFRSLMIYLNVPSCEDMLFKSEEYFRSLKRAAVNINNEDLIGFMSVLSDVRGDSRYNTNMRYLLETAVLRMGDKDRLTENISLKARVEKLEKRIEALIAEGFKATAPQREAPAKTRNPRPLRVQLPQSPAVEESAARDIACEVLQPPKTAAEPKASPTEEKKPVSPVETMGETIEDEDDDFDIPEEFAITEDDRDVMADMYEALQASADYINNRYRDQLLWGVVADMKPSSYDGEVLKIYPTGGSVILMEGFYAHEGIKRLEEAMNNKLGRPIKIEVVTPDEKGDKKKKENIDIARELFGELKELSENEGE